MKTKVENNTNNVTLSDDQRENDAKIIKNIFEKEEKISFNRNSHKYRRFNERYSLRSDKYTVVDNLGNKHITNKLKQRTKKERYNFEEWFKRIKTNNRAGKSIHRINEEAVYNEMVRQTEEREEKYLKLLIEMYGEEAGTQKHEQHLEDFEKRFTKKLDNNSFKTLDVKKILS